MSLDQTEVCTHHQQQINIVQPQALQALIQRLRNTSVVRRPHFCHDKDILALYARCESLLEALAHLVLVAVAVGAVDELVAVLEGVRNRGFDLASLRLPCSYRMLKFLISFFSLPSFLPPLFFLFLVLVLVLFLFFLFWGVVALAKVAPPPPWESRFGPSSNSYFNGRNV